MPLKRQLESPLRREELDETTTVGLSQHLDENSKMKEKIREHAEKNRERNREHAKKTRQRKKEMIEGMKVRLLELQKEVCGLFRFSSFETFFSYLYLLYLYYRRVDWNN